LIGRGQSAVIEIEGERAGDTVLSPRQNRK
jgi:hypothetical protein